MTQNALPSPDQVKWRRLTGAAILKHLNGLPVTAVGQQILRAAAEKAYMLLYGVATELTLALDLEVLLILAEDEASLGRDRLIAARNLLRENSERDPVTQAVERLLELTKDTDAAAHQFLSGVSAVQRFYSGQPEPFLPRLLEIGKPFGVEVDLSFLSARPEDVEAPAGPPVADGSEAGHA